MWCPCSFKFQRALEMQTESGQAALPAGLQTHGVYNQAHICHRCHSKEMSLLQSSGDFYLQNQVSPWLPLLNFRNTNSSSNTEMYSNGNTMIRHNLLTIYHDLLNDQKNVMVHYALWGLLEEPHAHSVILVIPWGQDTQTTHQETADLTLKWEVSSQFLCSWLWPCLSRCCYHVSRTLLGEIK